MVIDPQKITPFAETNFRSQRRRFGIKIDDRRRHMYVIGKTGMGKSTLLENMIISDIRDGHGLAVVDPHGDLVEKIIDYIPANRINDVVYFNPADIDFPIAFNALESVDSAHRHLVASGMIGVFKKIWADSWGPRLEYVLRNTILSLLEYPGSTILGITRLLVDNKYRKKVVAKISDPILKTFWLDEYASYSSQFRTEAISPIQNKVGQFLSSSIIRNIVGQTKSSIDMREVMDSGKILLMNLAKGRIGEDNSKLLGAMMITKLQLAAMSRVDMPEEERPDFFLFVDEFQNFATESFANILSEARKYHLDLIIAHQYIEQLDEIVRAAVFGNVGTLICFRVGAADGEFLEKEFDPTFTPTDLVNLAKYEMYLKLMIDGMASEPFSARGLPPIQTQSTDGHRTKIINVSRERYATPRAVVEEKIMRWSGLDENGELIKEGAAPRSTQPKTATPPAPSSATASANRLTINLAESTREADGVDVVPETPKPAPAISLSEALKQPPVPMKAPRRSGDGGRPDGRREAPRQPRDGERRDHRPSSRPDNRPRPPQQPPAQRPAVSQPTQVTSEPSRQKRNDQPRRPPEAPRSKPPAERPAADQSRRGPSPKTTNQSLQPGQVIRFDQ